MVNGLKIAGPEIFNIPLLILPWPCALLESKFWIILAILPWEKVTEDKRLLVKYRICAGWMLLLFVRIHCYQNNKLKKFLFLQEISYKSSGGIRGSFVVYKVF